MALLAASALKQLRSQALENAHRFADYNFQTYFTRHAEDKFNAVESTFATDLQRNVTVDVAAEGLRNFVQTEGPAYVAQMQRMATVNAMYATTSVVSVGHDASGSTTTNS